MGLQEKEKEMTEWNHKVCAMIENNSVDLETALLYLERNGYDVTKASSEYRKDLKDCGK